MNRPSPSELRAHLVKVAQGYVGESRANDPGQIGRFLGLFGLPFAENGAPLAFCAAGASWSACKALADLCQIRYDANSAPRVFQAEALPRVNNWMFETSASVSNLAHAAMTRGWWSAPGPDVTARPGDLVCFTWASGDHHVEIIAEDDGQTFKTVGFNTTDCAGHSGVVADKQRRWDYVWGIVRVGGLN